MIIIIITIISIIIFIMITTNNKKLISKKNTTSAAASTAKVVLGAAGVKAVSLLRKSSVNIGNLNIPLKRTEQIPIPVTKIIKKQSFVSSNASTMIFDMSVLSALNRHVQ